MKIKKSISVDPDVIVMDVRDKFIKKRTKSVHVLDKLFVDSVSLFCSYMCGMVAKRDIEKSIHKDTFDLYKNWFSEHTLGVGLRFNVDIDILLNDLERVHLDGVPLYDMDSKTVFLLDRYVILGNYYKFSKRAYKEIEKLLLEKDNNLFDIEKVKVIPNILAEEDYDS